MPEKALNWLKDVSWKTSSLIHYFYWILVFSLRISVCFEKEPCMAIYIEKIGVWNDSQMMWDSFHKP